MFHDMKVWEGDKNWLNSKFFFPKNTLFSMIEDKEQLLGQLETLLIIAWSVKIFSDF